MNIFRRVYRFCWKNYLLHSILKTFPEWKGKEPRQVLEDYRNIFSPEIARDQIRYFKYYHQCRKEGKQAEPYQPFPYSPLYRSVLNYLAFDKTKSALVFEVEMGNQGVQLLIAELLEKDTVFNQMAEASETILDRAEKLEDQFVSTLPEYRQN